MDASAQCDLGVSETGRTESNSASCSGSESSSTEEEERLRRLFQTCDRDGDGYIDSQDLAVICHQLNMDEAVGEIVQQLGTDEHGRISFEEFVGCRMRLIGEIEQEKMRTVAMPIPPQPSGARTATTSNMSWGSPAADNILGIRTAADVRDLDLASHDLYKLMESHDPEALQHMIEVADTLQGEQGGSNFLDVANSLHLSALTSLKGEIIELTNRLQHVTSERELLEKQLHKQQSERLRIQRDAEDRLEQQVCRYEERITELHSVIAELRKKIERHQINVIREEDEYEDDNVSNKSNDEASVNDNANESQTPSIAEIGADLNAELSRVVSELESAIGERQKIAAETHTDTILGKLSDNEIEEKAFQVCREMEQLKLEVAELPTKAQPPVAPAGGPPSELHQQLLALQDENDHLSEQIGRQEAELNRLKVQLGSVREDRDKMKRRVRELQTRVQSLEASTASPINSRNSTPTKVAAANRINIDPTPGAGLPEPQYQQPQQQQQQQQHHQQQQQHLPVAKVAGLKKLRTAASDRQVLGSQISSLGLPNAKVAEHLVQNMQECSSVQEISQSIVQSGSDISGDKIQEFEIEFERLTAKIDHLKSQNDLVMLTLEESKGQCDRLSVLMGKYESNNTALQLAINYSDQALEAYSVLISLMESEKTILLANCRAAGLGSMGHCGDLEEEQDEVTAILQKAQVERKTSENLAKQLLQRFDRSCGGHSQPCTASPWEDLSSNSRTASTTSSTTSSGDTEFTRVDEQKLRDIIQTLKNDRAAVKLTVMELESVHIDPITTEPAPNPDAQRLDLENAVLMQELMAMKEEKTEFKAANYLLQKEKSALDLQLASRQSQTQAYLVQIEALKAELTELHESQRGSSGLSGASQKSEYADPSTPSLTLAEFRSRDASAIANDLADALRRERKLKVRVQELVTTLEKLSRNAEIRHQQSAEFVSDLKRANSALVTAFEKAKKKYQGRMKKMESQIQALTERYESQIATLRKQLNPSTARPPDDCEGPAAPSSETSL